MNRNLYKFFTGSMLIVFSVVLCYCGSDTGTVKKEKPVTAFLNLGDSAAYVGMDACRSCHMDKYKSFIRTGMGMSFDRAGKIKSSADFTNPKLYDPSSDMWYFSYWKGEDMMMMEYRLEGKDTIHKRIQKVDYIIGSGQHTNSHICNTNGYLHQMPMTYYTQSGKWDLPPGFEDGHNTHFTRKIGLECMSCHNGFPSFVKGSENKFLNIPNGIDCERCHGPGSIHVRRKSNGEVIDTSRYIDYSIVNPGKLSVNLQFDICQRCHLQGNAILKPGKSFYDFRPGTVLKDYWTVFLPKFSGAGDEFIMASHADRLKMSPCFINTTMKVKESSSLRPYKDALTCVTCHNPHVSVRETGKEIFNKACVNCHADPPHKECTADKELRMKKDNDCVSCHMPRSGSIDIPHVTVTDHFIRKPVTKEEKEKMKKFIGLYAINETDPSPLVRAQGYINQYEKFELDPVYLDSAKFYLGKAVKQDADLAFPVLVQFYFIKSDFISIINLAEKEGGLELLNSRLTHDSWDNQDAWTCYRIGESYRSRNEYPKADKFFERAVGLAPFNQEFRNKYAVTLVSLSKLADAKKVFEGILKEDPEFAPAWCNLGYLYLLKDDLVKAEELYNKALQLDPDYVQALINKASLLYAQKRTKELKELVLRMKKRLPGNPQVKAMVKELKL